MKKAIANNGIVFIRTSQETKDEFLKALDKECASQNKVGNKLIKDYINYVNRKFKKNPHLLHD